MKFHRRFTLRATIILALVFLPVLVFVFITAASAANYCIGAGDQKECYPNLRMGPGDQTKLVDRTYLVDREPSSSKYWLKQYLGPNDQWAEYCNSNRSTTGKICVSKAGLATQPRLEMKDRRDHSGAGINMVLGLYGQTGRYWYLRQNSGYPSDGELDTPAYNIGGYKDGAKGLKANQLPNYWRYCPGGTNGWDDKFDVKSGGGMAGALVSESDRGDCYDISSVIVRRNGSNWGNDYERPIYKYIYHKLSGGSVEFQYFDSMPGYNSCQNPGGNCRSDSYRETWVYFGRCPCASDDVSDSECDDDNMVGLDLQANYTCWNKYQSGYEQKDYQNADVYDWRFRKVEQVPAFTIEQLDDADKSSYRDKQVGESWDGSRYIIYYGGEKVAKPAIPAIKDYYTDTVSSNKCAMGIIDVQRQSDSGGAYYAYQIHAEGHNKNAYEYISALEPNQRAAVIQALARVLNWDPTLLQSSTTDITFRLNNLTVVQQSSMKRILGDMFDDGQYTVLFGDRVAARTIEAVVEISTKNEGHMCRASLASPLGMPREYVYFTGVSSLPPPKIVSLRAEGIDDEIGLKFEQTGQSERLQTEMTGSRANTHLRIYSLNNSSGARVDPNKKVVIETYGNKTYADISWRTEHAQRLELIKYTNYSQNTKVAAKVSGPDGSKRFDNLEVNNTYSFVLVAENNRGPDVPTNWSDTSFVHVQRIDVEVKPVPLEIVEPANELPQSALLTGKRKCRPNVQSVRAPDDCIEVGWRVKGRPDRIVVKYPKALNKVAWTDHTETDGSYVTADARGSIRTTELNRNLTHFRIEASRGTISAEPKIITFSQGPQTFLKVATDGWSDGNRFKNTSIVELLNFADCEDAGFLLDMVCQAFSPGTITGILKVVVGNALGPGIGNILVRAIEPIMYGFVGMIANIFSVGKNISGAGSAEDWGILGVNAFLNLLPGTVEGIVSAVLGCQAARNIMGVVRLLIDATGFLFDFLGWDIGTCPQGKEAICQTGADVGKSLGVVAAGAITGELFGKEPPSCDDKKKGGEKPEEGTIDEPPDDIAITFNCSADKVCIPTTDKDAQYANAFHCSLECAFKRFTGSISIGWPSDESGISLNELHNRWASNALQQFCPDALGGRTIDRETAMTALIGSTDPTKGTGGLRSSNSGLFHCLWTVYQQTQKNTANADYNGTYYTDGGIPGSTVKECNMQDMLRQLRPFCASFAD